MADASYYEHDEVCYKLENKTERSEQNTDRSEIMLKAKEFKQ